VIDSEKQSQQATAPRCGRTIVRRALAHLSATRDIPVPFHRRYINTPDISAIRLLIALDIILEITGNGTAENNEGVI